jgi:hypothetical protein
MLRKLGVNDEAQNALKGWGEEQNCVNEGE